MNVRVWLALFFLWGNGVWGETLLEVGPVEEGAIQNALIGLTPTYDEWKVRDSVEDETGKKLWRNFSSLDLRELFPVAERTPREVACTYRDVFSNPGICGKLYVQILNSVEVSPPMALSVRGRTEKGLIF